MSDSVIHQLLDRHLEVLTELGSNVQTILRASPREVDVRSALVAAGYHDRDDIVDFFTWRGHRPLDQDWSWSAPNFFWETPFPINCEDAIARQRSGIEDRNDDVADYGLTPDAVESMFPGPAHFLPFTILDGVEWISIDCRPDPVGGKTVLVTLSSEAHTLFDSLADTIRAATYCLETSRWRVSDNGTIEGQSGFIV